MGEDKVHTPERQLRGVPGRQYCFGEFKLDLDGGFLLRRGQEVPLRPKSFEVLTYLVEHHGRLVGKDELISSVWADSATTDNSLAQCLLEIRRALDDDSQFLVRTVARRGYVFKGQLTSPPSESPSSQIKGSDEVFSVAGTELSGAKFEWRNSKRAALVVGSVVLATLTLWLAARPRRVSPSSPVELTQITNFPDPVYFPALSRDGKTLVFIRGGDPFEGGSGEIYLKALPDGQPAALTHDGTHKMGPVLSPDGSHVVYTVGWSSFSIPIAGGMPALFLPNAAGLTWAGLGRVLFSEIRDAPRLVVATASESRAGQRDVYVPSTRQGMAHFSFLSPNGKQVLVVEMTTGSGWIRCRLVPFDGSSSGVQVGPPGSRCTAAAWSPDGHWMYFAAEVDGESHLWRQHLQGGTPEQLTHGFDQEWGIAVDPDGRSLITSVGMIQSTVWYHDERGDRPVSAEGYAFRPQVSSDGAKVYYLVRRAATGQNWTGELWSTDLASGRTERALPDFLIRYFHVSRDNTHVVFDTFDETGKSRLWIASTDRSEAPHRLTVENDVEEERPFFGASGAIYFMRDESADLRFLYKMKPDGTSRQRLSGPITFLVNISPDETWAVLWNTSATSLLPLAGGRSLALCDCGTGPIFPDSPRINWSSDGKFLLMATNKTGPNGGETVLTPWKGVPAVPISGGRAIHETSVAPGPSPSTYAFARRSEQRNLYRIRLP